MADSSSGSADSRRNFLKIGAGVVVGAVVAGAGVAAYESSVIGSNNSSSSSTVASLSGQLSDTQNALNSAAAQISTLSSQLGSTQTALGNAQSSLSAANSQNANLSSQLTATQDSLSSASSQVASLQGTVSSQGNTISSLQGQVSTANAQVSSLNGQLTSLNSQVTSLNSAVTSANGQITSLQTQIGTVTGFLNLNTTEQACVAAMAEAIIPTDSNGPGATTAGVIYFIDRQLASDYGKNAQMYWKGPFVYPGLTSPITIAGTTYSGGSMIANPTDGSRYQYGLLLREFWRSGILAFEAYCNSAYSANFEMLSAADQVKALTDLTNNVPTSFNDIVPSDFFNEVFLMTWSGFLMDPLYGGNQGMVGWLLTGFNGVNMGHFYGEGYTTKQLMLATTPTRLQPASLAQFQQASGASN